MIRATGWRRLLSRIKGLLWSGRCYRHSRVGWCAQEHRWLGDVLSVASHPNHEMAWLRCVAEAWQVSMTASKHFRPQPHLNFAHQVTSPAADTLPLATSSGENLKSMGNVLTQKPRDPVSSWEKDKPKLRGVLQNAWPAFFKTYKVIENKERLRNCHRPEETKGTWWLNVMWHPRWNPRKEKKTLVENLVKSE